MEHKNKRKTSGQCASSCPAPQEGRPDSSADRACPLGLPNAPPNVNSRNASDVFKLSNSFKNGLYIRTRKITLKYCLSAKILSVKQQSNLLKCNIILKDCLSANLIGRTPAKKCGHPRCATCPIFSCNSNFHSNITRKKYSSINPNICKPLSCNSCDIIYLISCRKCGYQYIGQTTQEFKQRLNGHRKSIRLKERLIGQHFALPDHSPSDMQAQVVEKLIPLQGETKIQLRKRLLEREDYWMRELCTVWPYGLNDNVSGVGNVSSKYTDIDNIMSLFNKNTRRHRSHGHRKNTDLFTHQYITPDYLEGLMNREDGLHRVRTSLYCVPLGFLNTLSDESFTELRRKNISEQLFYIIGDIANHRLHQPAMIHSTDQKRYFMKIYFDNKELI